MDDHPEVEPAIRQLWAHVQAALAANVDKLGDPPSPCRIERLAAELHLELAASTVEGWFKAWSVVPRWEKFETLLKVLGAEQDQEWTELHTAAQAADRRHKSKQKKQKEQKEQGGRRKYREKERLPAQEHDVPSAHPTRGTASIFEKIPRLAWVAGGGIVIVAATMTIFFVSSGFYSGTPSPGTVLCARVITDRAKVSPKPDDRSGLIKYKYLNDLITIAAGHQSPPEWVTVRTPKNEPGYNWMRRNTLSEFTSCAD